GQAAKVETAGRFRSAKISRMRKRCTIMPVSPTTSALARRSKSRGSVFSSSKVTLCSGGVKAARSGRQADGMLAFLPKKGRAYCKPQKETSKRGLISTISAMTRYLPTFFVAGWQLFYSIQHGL